MVLFRKKNNGEQTTWNIHRIEKTIVCKKTNEKTKTNTLKVFKRTKEISYFTEQTSFISNDMALV